MMSTRATRKRATERAASDHLALNGSAETGRDGKSNGCAVGASGLALVLFLAQLLTCNAGENTLEVIAQKNQIKFADDCYTVFASVVFLPPLASQSFTNRISDEVRNLHRSISLVIPTACTVILSDEQSSHKLLRHIPMNSRFNIVSFARLPSNVAHSSREFRSYMINGCPLPRLIMFSALLRLQLLSNIVLLDSDILLLRDISHVFKYSFDVGLTLSKKTPPGMQPNGKSINIGMIFVKKSRHERGASLLESAAKECLNNELPKSQVMDQYSMHSIILKGQEGNKVKINPGGTNYRGAGQCVKVTPTNSSYTCTVLFLSDQYNSVATKLTRSSFVAHFTGDRKNLMPKFAHSLFKGGAKKFISSRRKSYNKNDNNWQKLASRTCS
ncbi:hypothetical protein RI054_16g75770 [Pseudoscourfieldia marina]